MVIGFYVHHEGAGHLTRAALIATALRERGHEVVLIGSGLGDHAGLVLPRDDAGDGPWLDPTASGALHWMPMPDAGTRGRMSSLARWVLDRRPDVVVVDVSAEVTVLLRLLGVPTVVVAQPGERDDEPHVLAYRCASAVLAPWPHIARPCASLRPHAWKVHHTGGISRLSTGHGSGSGSAGARVAAPRRSVGVVLGGRDTALDARVATRLRREVPSLPWLEVGGARWVDDIASTLATAAVVVTHAGQDAVADVAAAGVPAVVVPSTRPHREQEHLAAELGHLGLAVAVPPGAGVDVPWGRLVAEARRAPPRWWMWRTTGAVGRAADLVERVGAG